MVRRKLGSFGQDEFLDAADIAASDMADVIDPVVLDVTIDSADESAVNMASSTIDSADEAAQNMASESSSFVTDVSSALKVATPLISTAAKAATSTATKTTATKSVTTQTQQTQSTPAISTSDASLLSPSAQLVTGVDNNILYLIGGGLLLLMFMPRSK
jgi:carbohydrate-binding DOMON domain-containing protein